MTPTRRKWALFALVMGMAGAVHLRTISYGFTFDEQVLIRDNPVVHDLANLRSILLDKFWPGPVRGVYYRPLVTLSYALDYALAGDAPWVYHATNVALHGLAAGLIFLLLRRLAGREDVALVAALAFAVWPIHVESVVWVPGRTDVIATLLAVASWLVLLRARDQPGPGRRGLGRAAAFALYLAALGGKESAIVLPALIAAHDLIVARKKAAYWHEYGGLVLVTGLYLLLRLRALAGEGLPAAPDPILALPLMDRVLALVLLPGTALRLILFPTSWRIDYAYENNLTSPLGAAAAISALAVLGLLGLAAGLWRRRPLVSFAIAAFFISLLPVSHLRPFPTALAERFLYLPSLFVILAAVVLMAEVLPRSKAALIGVFLLILVANMHSVARGRAFRNDLSFWRAAARAAPERASVRNWLGIAYRNRGDWARAEAQYSRAVALDPAYTVARMNLAEVLLAQGRTKEAVGLLERLRDDDPGNPDLRYNLGSAYLGQGRWEEARREWEAALKYNPDHALSHYRLFVYYFNVALDCGKARDHFRAVTRLRPDDPALPKQGRQLRERCGDGP